MALTKLEDDPAKPGAAAQHDETAGPTSRHIESREQQDLVKLDEDLTRLRSALAELDQSLAIFESPPRSKISIDAGLETFESVEPPPVTTRVVLAKPAESATPKVGHEIPRMPTVREQPGPPPSLQQSSTRGVGATSRRFAVAVILVPIGVGALLWWRLAPPTPQAPAPPAASTPAPGVREIPVAAPEAATPAVAAPLELPGTEPAKSSTVVERTLPASREPEPVPVATETTPQPNSAVTSEPTVAPEAGVGAALGPLAPAPVAPREETEIALPLPPPAAPAISPSPPVPNPTFDDGTALQQLRQVVGRYELAYDRLDAQAAAAVWPSVDSQALARAFAALKQQDLELDNCTFRVSTTVATAECLGELRYVRRIGSSALRTEQHSWTIQFERAGEQWQVVSVKAR